MTDDSKNKRFERLYTMYEPLLHAVASRYFPDIHDRKDAVQHVSVKIWEKFEQLETHNNPKGYLTVVTRNHCLDVIRRTTRSPVLFSEPENIIEPLENQNLTEEMIEQVQHVMSKLTAMQRAVVEARRQGLPHEEIAQQLGISHAAVRKTFERACTALRRLISE